MMRVGGAWRGWVDKWRGSPFYTGGFDEIRGVCDRQRKAGSGRNDGTSTSTKGGRRDPRDQKCSTGNASTKRRHASLSGWRHRL